MIRNLTHHLFILLALTHLQGIGIGQLDSLLTASLQGRNQSRLLDVTVEAMSLGTPLVEIGWIVSEGYIGLANSDQYARETWMLAASSYMLTNAVTLVLKYTIKRERPPRHYQPRLWNTRITPSFPSGHTASSAAAATVAAIRYPQYTGAAIMYSVASGYSQVYTGNHYLGDVLTGSVTGYVVSRLLLEMNRHRDESQPAAANMIYPAINLQLAF